MRRSVVVDGLVLEILTRKILSAHLSDNRLVEEKRFADVLDLGYGAFQIKGFGEDYFEDLGV